MAQLGQFFKESGVKSEEKLKEIAPKTSVGRELINNLMYRVQRRGNTMVEMNGFFVEKVRIPISSNFFDETEKNLHLWVKPLPEKAKNGQTYLMLKVLSPAPPMMEGTKIRASDIFGPGINRVKL